jgi:multidrug efflux pump subunit AcrA (membrane-fusion protein)
VPVVVSDAGTAAAVHACQDASSAQIVLVLLVPQHYPKLTNLCLLCFARLQALLSAEQARHEASSAQSQLALARQQLRQAMAAAAKPLAMSGWEDLIEEAAADLEGLEGRVATAAQRLVKLQVCTRIV